MRYDEDVQILKRAILDSQYRAAKEANAYQLALRYAIGGYISDKTRRGVWGTGAIEAISDQLQKELPGLRGFSATNLRNMRLFYEAWAPSIEDGGNSSDASDESDDVALLAIHQTHLMNLRAVDAEAFLSIGFSHHCEILSKVKDREGRLFYVLACATNHYSVNELKRAIARDDWHHQGRMPNNFIQTLQPEERALRAIGTFKDEYLLDYINVEGLGARDALDVDERVVEQGIVLCKDMNKAFVNYVVRDYDKPMGVATYKTSQDMPEDLLRALPPIEDLESLLEGGEA